MLTRKSLAIIGLVCAVTTGALQCASAAEPHNVILFVPDGLRALMVNEQTAPVLAALRAKGVNFVNSHAIFPTFTMPNSSAMATGHFLGDTGAFSNTIYTGFAVTAAAGTVTPFIENDSVLGELDEHFHANVLNEVTLLEAARARGISTGAIGKVGPTLIFDHTNRSGEPTIVIDDATGTAAGIPLSQSVTDALKGAGLSLAAPPRGENGKTGDTKTPGTTVANVTQQDYFVDVATRVVLPMFKARNKPFLLVFWSRDPDGTQHNQGDSLDQVTPGINGPTSLAAIRNADNDLAKLQAALAELGLAENTNIFVTADHGFSTISKESHTSPAARERYPDVLQDHLPPGFVALDLATALKLPLFDPNNSEVRVTEGSHPKAGNGIIGQEPAHPDIVVAANGGSDLIYLPKQDKKLAAKVVAALLAQDYVSGLFVEDTLGKLPGTLPLSSINLKGSSVTPRPSIVVNFRTYSTGCEQPLNCAVEIADTVLQQGQGMHGSFSRADTFNFMAAIGPDFKAGYADEAPVSNADVGMTLANILGLRIPHKGRLTGRVLNEALLQGKAPRVAVRTLASAPVANGLRTVLNYQTVNATRYFDAAGIPERTLGLKVSTTKQK